MHTRPVAAELSPLRRYRTYLIPQPYGREVAVVTALPAMPSASAADWSVVGGGWPGPYLPQSDPRRHREVVRRIPPVA
jgi:hypothetical protein